MEQITKQNSIITLTFLRHMHDRILPKWMRRMPEKWKEHYALHHLPFLQSETDSGIEICMQTDQEGYFSPVWREQTKLALEQAKAQGAIIALSPMAADMPKGILPFANGKHLESLFAVEGAALALERMGKEREEANYIIADGTFAPILLDCLPLWVNHLGIVTDRPAFYVPYQEEFLSERGLVMEIFSSVGNPIFRDGDAVLSFAKGGRGMVYAMKDNSFFLDLAGNKSLLTHFAEARQNIVTADGFFFKQEEKEYSCMEAEAYAFCLCPSFRQFFTENGNAEEARDALFELGFFPCGFSIGNHRRKILRQ